MKKYRLCQCVCKSTLRTKHTGKPHGLPRAGLLTLLLLLALPTALQAQFTYSTNNGALTLTKYTGSGGDVTIPSAVYGLPVTAIGIAAFYPAPVNRVTFSEGVTNIMDFAFLQCSGLTNVTLPNSLTTIGYCAFSYCSNLKILALPNELTTLGANAFQSCGLITIRLPDSLTSIGTNAFNNCPALSSVTLGNGLTNIAETAFSWCSSLTNVSLGRSVTSIELRAFRNCPKLTTLTLPSSVTNLGALVVSECANLTGLYFQGNAPTLHPLTFYGSGATLYYLPGTTGWSDNVGGRPAKLWNPMVQASGPNFGVRNGQFGFNITGTADILIVVEACTDLANAAWQPLQTCTLTNGSVYFGDPAWTSYPSRIYRIRSP